MMFSMKTTPWGCKRISAGRKELTIILIPSGSLILISPGILISDNLACDVWLTSQFKDLDFDLILNPLTAKTALGLPAAACDVSRPARTFAEIERASDLVTMNNAYDIVSKDGPYDSSLEEIRNDPLIVDFRKWVGKEVARFDNAEVKEISRARRPACRAKARCARQICRSRQPSPNGFRVHA